MHRIHSWLAAAVFLFHAAVLLAPGTWDVVARSTTIRRADRPCGFVAEFDRACDVSHTTTALIPRAATIDGFTEASAAAAGVSLYDLPPLTTLHIDTRNSGYRVVVSHRTVVFVTGGRFFPDMTAARLEGASLGGSLLKLGWIGEGFCMEFQVGGQRIVTSPVRAIRRLPDPRTQ